MAYVMNVQITLCWNSPKNSPDALSPHLSRHGILAYLRTIHERI